MHRTLVAAALTAAAAIAPVASYAAEAMHRLAIHVDENDPKLMHMALNNAQNVRAHYEAKGESVAIEVVAYGPGLAMFVKGKSPVADRIAAMSLESEDISFAACGNTHRKMSEKAGQDVPLVSEAAMVPSGVVRLMELQEAGWSYLRP